MPLMAREQPPARSQMSHERSPENETKMAGVAAGDGMGQDRPEWLISNEYGDRDSPLRSAGPVATR